MRNKTILLVSVLSALLFLGCDTRPKLIGTVSDAARIGAAIADPASVSAEHTPEPTPSATPEPSPVPTAEPTPLPTPEPTAVPTATPFPEEWLPKTAPKAEGQYAITVFFGTQCAEVFEARNGQWVPIRRMICSTGKKTPTGNYGVHTKYEYHKLFGAYGQYCSRITGHILFHSVPIDEKARKPETGKERMKIDDYEALGTPASDGCVRLCCADAKWVWEHCDKTTAVLLTKESGPEPPETRALIKEAPYITEEGFGWDPTDPDPNNPYLTVYGPYDGMPG